MNSAGRKLRIAVWYNLPSGGAKRALHYHLAGLKARGHHLEAWRPDVSQLDFMPISEVVDKEHVVPQSWKAIRPGPLVTKVVQVAKEPDRMLQAWDEQGRACAAEIDRGGFDLLFANTCMFFHAPYIGRYLRIPKVLYLQEPNRPLYEPLPRLPWLPFDPTENPSGLRGIRARFIHEVARRGAGLKGQAELQNARSYDRILVNSFFSREAVLRAYGLNSKVCYLGIDSGIFADQSKPRERFVIGIGTFGPTKNIMLAVEAVGTIPLEKRPALVWVANMQDEPYLAACIARAKELGVDLQPKKMISDVEMVDLLNRATAMVYAPRLEPFGFAPLEANFCGTPVVGVAEGGVRETVQDGINGLLVDHDPREMGRAIVRLLDDPGLARRLGEQGRELAREKWSVEASIDRLEAELFGVLHST